MSKTAIANLIREGTDCTVVKAKKTTDAIFDMVTKAVKKEGSFTIVGFGTFKATKRGARKGRNPKTGAVIKIAASKSVRFKPSAALKKKI
jgi:DNA-binding protein HU-beta